MTELADGTSSWRLDGQVAVITGAAQGLGAICGRVLAELGAKVVLLDVNADLLEQVATELKTYSDDVLSLTCDVSDEASVNAAVAATRQRFGRCDLLVNNAGIINWTPLYDLELADWERVLRVNLTGSFLCTKYFGRLMIDAGRGSIVNINSVAASSPEAGAGAYSASKGGTLLLTQQTAVEFGPLGVRANSVSPGMMRTPMAERFLSDPETYKGRVAMVPSRRIGTAEEVAQVIAFLGMDASSYINGQNIEVDGGLMRSMIKMIPRPGVRAE